MSPLSCAEVKGRLDLFADGECAAAEAAAIRRHLAACPSCAAAHQEARQMLALLDLRLQEPERLRRLEERIAAEDEPRPRVLRFPSPGVWRFAALAAMLLLAVGLSGWLTPLLEPAEDGGLAVALHQEGVRGLPEARVAPAADFARGGPKSFPEGAVANFKVARPEDHRPPPEVDLALELRNTTDREMRVEVSGPRAELRLDLRGLGAVAEPGHDEPAVEAKGVTLRPGASHTLTVARLEDGRAGARRRWYWTEPGDYTLTARFTTIASSPGMGERRITARSAPVTIHVEGK